MPGAPYANLGDLLNDTLPELDKKFTETLRQTDYPLTRLFFTEFKRDFSGGKWREKRIRVKAKTTFRFENLYEVTAFAQEDLMAVQYTNWSHWREAQIYDEKEIAANTGEAQIINLMQERRSGVYESIYNGIETALTNAPTTAPTQGGETKSFWGLPYWGLTLETGTSDPTGGFNGKTVYFQDGSNSTTRAGLDLSSNDNQRARNFVGTYSGFVDAQFVDLLRRAMTRTNFGTLLQLEGEKPADSTAGGMYIVASHDMCDQMESRINKGPDDQQGDIERFTQAQFRGVKFVRTPTIDSVSYNPLWGIKKSKTFGIVLGGRWMKELPSKNDINAPEVFAVPVVGSCNLTCDDPRSGIFCLHTVR